MVRVESEGGAGAADESRPADSTQPILRADRRALPLRSRGLVLVHPRRLGAAPAVWKLVGDTTLGRSRDCGVRLEDPCVSRLHARVRLSASGVSVSDLGSQHGTFVNAERVGTAAVTAAIGSVLRVGDSVLLVSSDCEAYRALPRRLEGAALGLPRPLVAGPALARTWDEAARVASVAEPLLVLGESGSGKESIARLVHQATRPPGPFVGLNVAAIPDNLFEAELFGYERGAFTGAVNAHLGAFREASGGVLFLDEVADLRANLQVKLLRAIDLQCVRPLGARRDVPTRVRLVAATSQDLSALVERGQFRADLYYRLAGIVLRVPPLRERPDEIVLLALALLDEIGPGRSLSGRAAEQLVLRSWPGNARALRHAIVHAVARAEAAQSSEILPEHLPPEPGPAQEEELSFARISSAMSAAGGVASRAADLLRVSRSTFYKACKRLNIQPEALRET